MKTSNNIKWQSSPKGIPYILNSFSEAILVYLIGFVVFYLLTSSAEGEDYTKAYRYGAGIFLLVAAVASIGLINKIINVDGIKYSVSDKFIHITSQKGYGSSTDVCLSEIREVKLEYTIWDRLFKSATVRLFIGETEIDDGIEKQIYTRLHSVSDFEMLRSILLQKNI